MIICAKSSLGGAGDSFAGPADIFEGLDDSLVGLHDDSEAQATVLWARLGRSAGQSIAKAGKVR